MPSRLKSIEVNGYKTFASKMLFEFADNVTAIVGPNGSGKSNIADAMRWVLGEQAFSLLRGRKTEDMIFSGSEQRPKAGMASVIVTFDNGDGWLPIDYSEVSVGRRAYRDGQNEYLINGQKVRLRDVTELLAQSGLAERTYTVIGQGLVDAALALKADERRRLFEEAAGIGLYRTRRQQALRRLDTTRRNLDRVKDILAELTPRLRSLQRQSRRAEQYDQVKKDLDVVLREWYGFHWHAAQRDFTSARSLAREQETHLHKVRNTQTEFGQRLAENRENIQSLRARLNSWHRQLAQLHTGRENVSRDMAVGGERLRSLEEQRQALTLELTRAEEEALLHEDRLARSDEVLKQAQLEYDDAIEQAEQARQKLENRALERQQVEEKSQDTQETLQELNNRQVSLEVRKTDLEARSAALQETLGTSENTVFKAEQSVSLLSEGLAEAGAVRESALLDRKKVEERLRQAQDRIGQIEETRKHTMAEVASAQAEIARKQAQLEVLVQADNALAGYASGARMLLQAAQQSQLQGLHSALSSQLEIPAELETAIAAALGEYVDAVLLEAGGDLDKALNLVTGENVRAALLPLDRLKPPSPLTPPAGEDCLGVASDLIKVAPELRPAVDLLLGQVLIVRNRAAARWVLSEQSGQVRAVTLRGEVFHASGLVVAGQEGGAGALSRPRQRRELREALKKDQDKVTALEEQVGQMELDIQGLQSEQREVEGELQSTLTQQEQTFTLYQEAVVEVEQARRNRDWQTETLRNMEAEITRSNEEIRQIKAEFSQIEGQIASGRETMRSQSAALAGLSLEEAQAQLTHWEKQTAVSERTVEDARSRREERAQSAQQSLQRERALKDRLSGQEDSMSELDSGKVEMRQMESEIAEQIEAIQVLIEPAEAELEEVEKNQDSIQDSESDSRHQYNSAERNNTQAQVALARKQEALDTLRQRIQDDFGLVDFEYTPEVSGPTPLPLAGLVERLAVVEELSPETDETLNRLRTQLRRMGAINPEAQNEFQEVQERFEFLTSQVADLEAAEEDVKEVIAELDVLMQREFRKTFDAVAREFRGIFTRLFGGGTARLILTDPDNITETGIEIDARLPGRRTQGLSLLSGGERSLTATALIFALIKTSPTPFCFLDEVDAMLDEANLIRFRELLTELSQQTQFVIITHNRNTVQAADVIYGVTMGRDSASQVISLKLDEVTDIYSS